MRPAASVIVFTVVSGAGYGLLALLCLFALFGALPAGWRVAGPAFAGAVAMIGAGFLASTFHLGHPERAWRAMSQWRTSWLAREGALALLTFPVAALFAALWLWPGDARPAGALVTHAVALVALAVSAASLFATSMIYGSLRAVHQWRSHWVPAGYFALALLTGALWLHFAAAAAAAPATAQAAGLVALAAAVAGAIVKLAYWSDIDATAGPSTAESATGLGRFGKVRLLDPPHSEENFLLHEMGFRIARKHARKLRRIAVSAGFALPALAVAASLGADSLGIGSDGVRAGLAGVAAVSAMAGVLVERWLFFAEAKHTVMLYYGAATS